MDDPAMNGSAVGGSSLRGFVLLVGAGPGDPELITVRGLRALRQADVVVYDRLVHPDLVAEAPDWAERIFVGKAREMQMMRQEEINALLVARARAGLTVVRLKGGDPFVFGRGGEEATALREARIAHEIVPAVSSAVAAPARAGIPVTQRGVAASFAVVPGHRAAEAGELDWAALARIDTLVILMGMTNLPSIVRRLLDHGRAPETPAAIVERATLPGERVITSPLGALAERAAAEGAGSPSVIVVGEVARLARGRTATLREVASAAPPFLMSGTMNEMSGAMNEEGDRRPAAVRLRSEIRQMQAARS